MATFGNDETPNIGKQICHAATGAPCEDSMFGFNSPAFVEIGSAQGPKLGDSVVVSMSDPASIGSDEHLCLLVFNNDPTRVLFKGLIEEGTLRKFDIRNEENAETVNLWCEKNVQADVAIFKTADAAKIIENNDKSVVEKASDGVKELLDEAQKKADDERRKLERMLIGAAVFIVVIVVIAAITLPKLKIPSVNVV